jgi:hypothetical protein
VHQFVPLLYKPILHAPSAHKACRPWLESVCLLAETEVENLEKLLEQRTQRHEESKLKDESSSRQALALDGKLQELESAKKVKEESLCICQVRSL